MEQPDRQVIETDVRRALAEDVGSGDLTAALLSASTGARARVVSRETAVMCGQPWFDEVFRQVDQAVSVAWRTEDGETIAAGKLLCELNGPARAILTGERVALNFLQTLSGTATQSRAYAEAVAATSVRILDTRKTIPGLRVAQKYAVRCGGCYNHRIGLYDGILIKENHIRSAGSISAAVAAAQASPARVPVEVEIESLSQLEEALSAGADIVMLDNFSHAALREAVLRNRAHPDSARLEASGNVSLDTIAAIAATGVDFISVGALTKHVHAVDLSMQFDASSFERGAG